jgi:hypothetical protein
VCGQLLQLHVENSKNIVFANSTTPQSCLLHFTVLRIFGVESKFWNLLSSIYVTSLVFIPNILSAPCSQILSMVRANVHTHTKLQTKLWMCIGKWPPLWSSGQSFSLQIQRSWVRFPVLSEFLRSRGSWTGSTQHREDNWGATWMKKVTAPV